MRVIKSPLQFSVNERFLYFTFVLIMFPYPHRNLQVVLQFSVKDNVLQVVINPFTQLVDYFVFSINMYTFLVRSLFCDLIFSNKDIVFKTVQM